MYLKFYFNSASFMKSNFSNNSFIPYDLKLKFLDYEYIFHLAAIVGVDNVLNNPYKVLCLNTITLINVVNFAKKQK